MKFVDHVRVHVRAGRGGDGAVAWRREKYVPRGGPAGGDGGRGGDVVFVADQHLSTLLDLRYRHHLFAEDGRPGGTSDKYGRAGESLVVRVPVGTMIYVAGSEDDSDGPVFDPEAFEDDEAMATEMDVADEDEDDLETTQPEGLSAIDAPDDEPGEGEAEEREMETIYVVEDSNPLSGAEDDEDFERPARPVGEPGTLLGDLSEAGQQLVIARGGRGGRGNIHFRTATNRAPDFAEPGRPGQDVWLRLELKLLADVGIVGFPNVGKSTLISRISRARPRIADYPFTTLIPQLGVVRVGEGRSMVVADVPGLIRGASEGKGLGLQFLRHLERTRVLLHLLSYDLDPSREPLDDLDALENELRKYGAVFEGRPRVVALNKLDTLQDPDNRRRVAELRKALRARNIPLFPISAATGEGIEPLLEAIWRRLETVRDRGDEILDPLA